MPDVPKTQPTPRKVGGVDTKWWIVGGVATVGIVWWSIHKAKNSAPVDATATTTDPTIDPATGIPYSQESMYDTGYSAAPSFGGGGGGVTSSAEPATTTLDGSTTTPQSLQAWLLEAESWLLAAGYNPNDVTAALGAVGSGQPLTGTQQGTVASAAGGVGAPPVTTTTDPTGSGDTAPAPQPAPAPAPPPAPAPLPTMTAPSLRGVATADHKAQFTWNEVAGAKGYNIYLNGAYHLYETNPSFESAAHAVGYKYGAITVKAIRAADGAPGPSSNAVTVTIR